MHQSEVLNLVGLPLQMEIARFESPRNGSYRRYFETHPHRSVAAPPTSHPIKRTSSSRRARTSPAAVPPSSLHPRPQPRDAAAPRPAPLPWRVPPTPQPPSPATPEAGARVHRGAVVEPPPSHNTLGHPRPEGDPIPKGSPTSRHAHAATAAGGAVADGDDQRRSPPRRRTRWPTRSATSRRPQAGWRRRGTSPPTRRPAWNS